MFLTFCSTLPNFASYEDFLSRFPCIFFSQFPATVIHSCVLKPHSYGTGKGGNLQIRACYLCQQIIIFPSVEFENRKFLCINFNNSVIKDTMYYLWPSKVQVSLVPIFNGFPYSLVTREIPLPLLYYLDKYFSNVVRVLYSHWRRDCGILSKWQLQAWVVPQNLVYFFTHTFQKSSSVRALIV